MKIENVTVFGFESAIHGMRMPKNSMAKSDSVTVISFEHKDEQPKTEFILGEADKRLATRLISGGTEHRKFTRMIHVQFDMADAPQYFFAEFDTYKVGVVRDSSSFQHKGTDHPYTMADFEVDEDFKDFDYWHDAIANLNALREKYLETKDYKYFRAIRQFLPMGYRYKSTIDLNYEVLLTMHRQRKNHALKEWHFFCDWIESLPYMKEFIAAAEGK